MGTVRLAIAGVGNCASSLVQGIARHGRPGAPDDGLMRAAVGGYRVADLEVVAAFDVDARKVGRPLQEAVFAPPNCAMPIERALPPWDVTVAMGPVLDGVAPHMALHPAERSFRVADAPPVDVAAALRAARADVLCLYLPAGSEEAARHYARACLAARVALVNCIPVFIASSDLGAEFAARGVPVIGDDVKSQFGATILHRAIARLMVERGLTVERSYQLNVGGNTDFLNMRAEERLASKRASKTDAVQSQLDAPLPADRLHIGPSDYVAWQGDTKVCFLRVEARGFGGAPVELEARLRVEDSPNSAGVVLDAVRCAKVALDRGVGGPLRAPSAWFMKHPPRQVTDDEARVALDRWLEGGPDLPARA